MISKKLIFISIVSLVLFCSCATTQKIAALKPEADDATPLIFDSKPSFVNLPITLKISEIEQQVNLKLNGLIYEDLKIEDDDLILKVWKQAPIRIKNVNGKIQTLLPLKIYAKYRVGTSKLGVNLYRDNEFNLNGTVELSSDVDLKNWKLSTKTSFKNIKWKESPTTTVMGKEVSITYLINPALQLFKNEIEKSIDKAIEESMDFKPNVLEALENISVPTLMNEEYETWVNVSPIELYATDAVIKNQEIALQMGMKCLIETTVGTKPLNKFNKDKIILKAVKSMPNTVSTNIVAISTYSDASKIITKNFAGQVFGDGNKKVTVNTVEIWHKSDKIVVALNLSGSFEGTIYLAGFPKYNDQTKEIYFDDLDYVLDTKNKLIKTANWFASGLILKKIKELCKYSIAPNLEDGKKIMSQYTQNYSPIKGVFINGQMGEIKFKEMQLSNKAIIAFLNIEGSLKVTIDGL